MQRVNITFTAEEYLILRDWFEENVNKTKTIIKEVFLDEENRKKQIVFKFKNGIGKVNLEIESKDDYILDELGGEEHIFNEIGKMFGVFLLIDMSNFNDIFLNIETEYKEGGYFDHIFDYKWDRLENLNKFISCYSHNLENIVKYADFQDEEEVITALFVFLGYKKTYA